MALLNSNNRYIKLEKDGNYKIYASEEARKRIKESTPGETILAKYRELLKNLESPEQAEFRYYDPEGFAKVWDPLNKEYHDYWYDFSNYITGNEYPIMAQYYPDVADSIPEVIVVAGTRLLGETIQCETIEEAYIKAKQVKRFGETIDV